MAGMSGVGPLTLPALGGPSDLVDWASVASLASNGESTTGVSGAMAIGPLHAQLLAQIGSLDLRVRQLVAQLVDQLQPGIVSKQSGEWSFSINQLTESTIVQIYALLAAEKASSEAQLGALTGSSMGSQLLGSSPSLTTSGSFGSTPTTPFSPSSASVSAQSATTAFPGSPNGLMMPSAAGDLNQWLLANSAGSLVGAPGFSLAASLAQQGNSLTSSASALEKLNAALNSTLSSSTTTPGAFNMGSSSAHLSGLLPAFGASNPGLFSQLNAAAAASAFSQSAASALQLSSDAATGHSMVSSPSAASSGHKRGPNFSSLGSSASPFGSASEFDAFAPSSKRSKHYEPRDSGRLHSLKLASRLEDSRPHTPGSLDGCDSESDLEEPSDYSVHSHSDGPSSPSHSSTHMMGVIPSGASHGSARHGYNFGQKLPGAPSSLGSVASTTHHHGHHHSASSGMLPASASSSTSTTINAEEGIYSCNHCKRCYPGLAALNKHMRVHHDERHFSCSHPGCNKRFSHSSTLKDHMNIHFQRKPYICKECGKGFPNGSNLNRHARIHTKSKPYVCPVCNKAFSQSSNLRVHQKIHERPPRFASE